MLDILYFSFCSIKVSEFLTYASIGYVIVQHKSAKSRYMTEYNKKSSNIRFPFGKQLFIGIINFYSIEKGVGYIVSNNLGMSYDKRFAATTQNFYIDNKSFKELPKLNKLVVFQPAFQNGKLKALNVRQYNIEKDRELALTYYNKNNFILYTEKERIRHRYKSDEIVENKVRVSILSKSDIFRYKLLYEYCKAFAEKGPNAILFGLSKLIYAAGGEIDYYHTLNGNYGNKEHEHEAIKHMFDVIDFETSKEIVKQHPSLQPFAPISILLEIAEDLNPKFRMPKECVGKYKRSKLEKIINERRTFECYFTDEEKKKKLWNHYLPKTEFTSLLDSCPEEIKSQCIQHINRQMHDGIDSYIANIANESKKGKVNFLKIYKEFIDSLQKHKILQSIDDDIISEINIEISDILKCKCDINSLRSFTKNISEKFYRNDSYVQEKVKVDIVKTILQIIPQVINDITINEYHWQKHGIYKALKEIIEGNKFVHENCLEQIRVIIKEHYRSLFSMHMYDSEYDENFIFDFKDIFDAEERNLIINQSAEGILSKGSLRQIYNFFHMFADKNVPLTIEQLIKIKSVDDIVDCGQIFSAEIDKGLSLLGKVLVIIKKNCDSKGNFIIDSVPDGKRGYFIGQFIYNLRETDTIKDFIHQLSFHDRIVLSQSREYGFDIASKDDIKKELLGLGVNADTSHILQGLRYCSHAIVDIIISTPCLTENDIREKILWLRKYYSIEKRKYCNIGERLDSERKLLAYWNNIQSIYGFDVAPYGIDVKRKQVALSYADYKKHSDFLSVIWKATTIEDANFILEFTKEDFDVIDKNDVNLIERVVGRHFEEKGKSVRIELAKSNAFNINTVLSYITVNVLNNFSIENRNEDIVIVNDQRIISYISSIIHMTAKDYMEAFWRVGDRGDIEHYYKDIVIEFEEAPNKLIKAILMDIIPNLTCRNDSKVFEYHYSETEVASGYGRSWDWENNEKYKNSILIDLIIKIFETYKEGQYIDLALQ